MSWWSIKTHIGECRPFPAQVVVYKGETNEHMTYVPECCRVPSSLEAENRQLRELVRVSIEFCANGMCGLEDGCPLNAADGRCMFDERARELGVQVTDD